MTKVRTPGLDPRVHAAMLDCVEEVGDAVYELQRSIEEMDHAGGSNFSMVMNDVETWVSAALTDDDTCMDGFDEGAMKKKVKTTVISRHLRRIARLTSNALALVNRYASTKANLNLNSLFCLPLYIGNCKEPNPKPAKLVHTVKFNLNYLVFCIFLGILCFSIDRYLASMILGYILLQ
ncbi:hypothetical protein NC651_009750 [Populus alba x Populus x berolinensis]|nr:hypothetical protein NC651_009750 [Populus alba x Populus x berolinensis]